MAQSDNKEHTHSQMNIIKRNLTKILLVVLVINLATVLLVTQIPGQQTGAQEVPVPDLYWLYGDSNTSDRHKVGTYTYSERLNVNSRNMGIDGETSSTLKTRVSKEFKGIVEPGFNNICMILIGVNDFRHNTISKAEVLENIDATVMEFESNNCITYVLTYPAISTDEMGLRIGKLNVGILSHESWNTIDIASEFEGGHPEYFQTPFHLNAFGQKVVADKISLELGL
ncbi:MAG: SGNH/GDSL hydrolase family protein [Candidatus Dojkabacteria bacterium]